MMLSGEAADHSSKGIDVYQLGVDEIDDVWVHFEDRLDAHPETWQRYYRKEEILEGLKDGSLQGWIVATGADIHAMALTIVRQFPIGLILQVEWLVGEGVDNWLDALDTAIENFALVTGCELIEVNGRGGWTRKLQKRGFTRQRVSLARVVNGGLQ